MEADGLRYVAAVAGSLVSILVIRQTFRWLDHGNKWSGSAVAAAAGIFAGSITCSVLGLFFP